MFSSLLLSLSLILSVSLSYSLTWSALLPYLVGLFVSANKSKSCQVSASRVLSRFNLMQFVNGIRQTENSGQRGQRHNCSQVVGYDCEYK